jgi:hypothetical protein
MPKNRSTNYHRCMIAAQRTVDLIDHEQMPDRISDVVLETLIEMSDESRMQIWHKATGISLETLAALYTLYERGAGYRRSRLYGRYEAERIERRLEETDGQS